ncbi:hypothetical protein [Paenibacillus sp. NPDC093718]|uniref:hypothetical protein n=1 Tax=Paenibacillus sp. NPDC093718 TaxID=3390601 RepID=UPI003D0895A3
MFKVRRTFNHTIVYTVYGVQQLENGLTQFLIWNDMYQKWSWFPASEFEPIELPREVTEQ